MTGSFISLLSILIGIIGANSTGYFLKKYSIGGIGNTIIGVFGSVFFIKFFGRLGFDVKAIIALGDINIGLLTLNAIISFFGGAVALILAKITLNNLNK